jgi:ParB family chromosome partitioning protein
MYRILNPEAYKKPSPVEAFEAEKIQVKDTETMLKMKEQRLDTEANIPNDILFGKKDDEFVKAYDVEPTTDTRELFGGGLIKITDIVRKEPFSNLFDINLNTLESIAVNMRNNGYDFAFPVILWGNILVDGYTRTKAAEEAGLEEIPCEQKEFKNEHEALEYAMHNQRDRRNISEAELLRCISVIDTPMSKTEAGAVRGEKKTPSHKQTAKTLGVGESVVTDARTVLKDEKVTEEVKEGKKTLREAAEEVRSRKRKPKETISEALTKVESIIGILKDNAGKEMKLGLLLKQSESLGVKEDMMSLIMEVLTAVNLVKISGDKLSIKKAIK